MEASLATRTKGIIVENESYDQRLIVDPLIYDGVVETDVHENVPVSLGDQHYDFACFDYLVGNNINTLRKAILFKKNNPSTLTGFITRVPEKVFNYRHRVDFVLYKQRMHEDDYKPLILRLILHHKLSRLARIIEEDQVENSFSDLDLKKILDISKLIDSTTGTESFSNVLRSVSERCQEGFLEMEDKYDIAKNLALLLEKLMDDACSYVGLVYWRDAHDIITSDFFMKVEPNYSLMSSDRIFAKYPPLDFDVKELSSVCYPKVMEVTYKFMVSKSPEEILANFSKFRVYHDLPIVFPFKYKDFQSAFNEAAAPPDPEYTVPFALYPSGAFEPFGEVKITKAGMEIVEKALYAYLDPLLESDADLQQSSRGRLFVFLLEF